MSDFGIFFFKLLISLTLIILLALYVDLTQLVETLYEAKYESLALAVILIVFQSVSAGLRWQQSLNLFFEFRNHSKIQKIYFGSVFVNQFMPASVGGDVFRIGILKLAGVPAHVTTSSIILERIVMLVSILAIVAIQQIFILQQSLIDVRYIILALILLAATFAFSIYSSDYIANSIAKIKLEKFASYYRSTFNKFYGRVINLTFIWKSTALSILGQTFFCIAVFMIISGLNIPLSIGQAFIIGPVILLAATLPISLGGWGIREGITASCFFLLNADVSDGILTGLMISLVTLVAALPGAFFLMDNYQFNNETK